MGLVGSRDMLGKYCIWTWSIHLTTKVNQVAFGLNLFLNIIAAIVMFYVSALTIHRIIEG